MAEQRTDARLARQGAVASLALSWIGLPLSIVIERDVPGIPAWPKLLALGVTAALTSFLLVRRLPSVRESSAIFVLNNLGALFSLWISGSHYTGAPPMYLPFEAHKLAMLAVAVIAPGSPWVGAMVIALYSGGAIIQLATLAPEVRDRLPIGQTMTMLFFTLFALCLLYYRSRRQALAGKLDRAQGEAAALKKVARQLLAVRDLANTPLQTIEADTALLQRVEPARVYAERIQRSLDRLREWQGLLDEEANRSSRGSEDMSFDPRSILKPPN
jgi:hypothetical protein